MNAEAARKEFRATGSVWRFGSVRASGRRQPPISSEPTGGLRLPLACALLALLLFVVPALAQVPRDGGRGQFIPPKDDGFHLLRGLLHFHGVRPVSEAELQGFPKKDYADLIVVILGSTDRPFRTVTQATIRNGGAVLIARDDACDLTGYFPPSGNRATVSVAGNTIEPHDIADCYAWQRAFPLLRPVADALGDGPFATLFANRRRIATNQPSQLVRDGFHASLMSTAAMTPAHQNAPRGGLFAIGGVGDDRNPYRALVLADPDLLSNQMLYSSGIPDRTGQTTDNWVFANDLVKDFLRGPHGRSRCLFIESGSVIEKFDDVELKSIQSMQPLPQIPLPNPLDRNVQRKLAELIDGGLAKLEDNTAADNLIAGRPNEPGQRRYQLAMMVLGGAAAVALVGLMARRLFAARHKKAFVPAPTDPLFLGDHALGSFAQRRAELLRGDDFGDAVAHRIRTLFAARGLPPDFKSHRLPPLEFRSRADRQRLEAGIRRLWAVAGDDGVPLPYSEWKDWEPILADVHAAAVADHWRFAATPEGSA